MIEVKDKNSSKNIKFGSYPADYKIIGEFEEDFKIFINEDILNDIKGYLSSDKEKELGGILLGDIFLDESNNQFIIINELVIARYTEANVTRLTFTHKTWEDINSKIERDFPGKTVLGWFHSHPGHTVFLSTYDKFIHENFFSGNSYVAYVFDPINNEEGFFYQKDEKLVKANCFYIYSDFQNKNGNNKPQNDITLEKKTKKNNPIAISALIISLICLIITSLLLLKYFELNDEFSEINNVSLKIKDLKEENIKTNNKIDKFISGLESGKDSINKNSDNIIKYQIKPGDTLRKLALFYYNDEGKYNELIRYNNLKDENDISVGQIIEIPLEKYK